jgi:enoyl-CoA hydratase/carnithine racemase
MTMETDYNTLQVTRPRDSVALLTLNRPERLNAVTFEMFEELHDFCATVSRDAGIRAVVMTANEMMLGQERWAGAMEALHALPQPVIAAVNGPAAGGGLAFALAADIRLASPAARFNAAFVRIGLSAGDIGVSWSLPRIVGLGLASEIMLTGRFVEAEEAARIGLVNRVVEADELLDVALEVAELIASNSPFGVTLTKRVLMANVDAGSLRGAIEVENRGQTLATRGSDFGEALGAFRAKRAPNFTGS